MEAVINVENSATKQEMINAEKEDMRQEMLYDNRMAELEAQVHEDDM